MDILSHCTSGIAVASCAMAFTSYKTKTKVQMLLIGGLTGAFPDFDALSLWSRFDTFIGKPLGLPPGNHIYFSKYWYSHHAFLHSFLAAILFSLFLIFLIRKIKKNPEAPVTFIIKHKVLFITLVLGYCAHLLEDMPTPACVWGGVNFFFPSSGYVGGTGQIWWWNNYDLFLIINTCTVLNIVAHLISKLHKLPLKVISLSITSFCIVLFIYQINTRGYDFSYDGFSAHSQEMEMQSKNIQKRELGNTLYNMMLSFDNSISLNF